MIDMTIDLDNNTIRMMLMIQQGQGVRTDTTGSKTKTSRIDRIKLRIKSMEM